LARQLGAQQLTEPEVEQEEDEDGVLMEAAEAKAAEVEVAVPTVPQDWTVVRSKNFPMPPISVQEAVSVEDPPLPFPVATRTPFLSLSLILAPAHHFSHDAHLSIYFSSFTPPYPPVPVFLFYVLLLLVFILSSTSSYSSSYYYYDCFDNY